MNDDSIAPEEPLNEDGGTRPPRRWKRSGREQFVEAAVAYLDALGDSGAHAGRGARASDDAPPELGIRVVAELLKKSPSAPLFHFPDRLTLLAAVAAEGFRRQTEFFRPDGSSPKAAPAPTGRRQALLNIALSYVDWAGEHPALWAVMYTPALAPGAEAILTGNEDYWREGSASDAGTTDAILPITEPAGRRRLAFQELHDAKMSAWNVFWTAVEQAKRNRELSRETPTVDIVNAVVTMADGLAWQRVSEHQWTLAMMRQYAERAMQLLMKGIG